MKRILFVLSILFSICAEAQIKISAMPTLPGTCDTCWVPIVKGSINYKARANQLFTGGGGGGGSFNPNKGSGFRLGSPTSDSIKTLFGSWALNPDSSSNTNGITFKLDTTLLSTRAWRQKGIDSIGALLAGYVATSRTINTTYPLQGGGDLSADRTFNLDTALGKWRSEGYYDTKYLTAAGISNIYTTNGTLLGNRILYGHGGDYSLLFDSLSGFVVKTINASYRSIYTQDPGVITFQSTDLTGNGQETFMNYYPDSWEIKATKNTGYYAHIYAYQGDTSLNLNGKNINFGNLFSSKIFFKGSGVQRISGGGVVLLAMDSTGRQLGWTTITPGTGTVTSVATNTGSGITGGTITNTGTIAADTTSVLSTKANVLSQLTGYTPTSRTITINGSTQDLSANRTWNVGTLVATDTANKYVTRIYRKTASDSVFYVKGGVHTFAFIDSVGSFFRFGIEDSIGNERKFHMNGNNFTIYNRSDAANILLSTSNPDTSAGARLYLGGDSSFQLRNNAVGVRSNALGTKLQLLLNASSSDTTLYKPLGRSSDGTTVQMNYWPVGTGGGGGETNTASNLGGGLDNYSTKVGVDLRFNSFDASDFDLASNLISIDATLKSTWNGKLSSTDRRLALQYANSTDANLTAAPGYAYNLPAATLSANRTIDVTALNTNGDYIELYNNETGFVWSFTGATVYDSDGTTAVTELLANTNSVIRRVNGKLMISKL